MSQFLGTVHYMMDEKIKCQDRLTATLLNQTQLAELNKYMPPVSTEPLEKIIDQDNIHGFLSARIDVVESRLAYAILHGEDVVHKAFDFGKSLAPEGFNGTEDIFQQLNLVILDGMPCDRAMEGQLDEAGRLHLVCAVDTHKTYADFPLSIDPADSLDKTCAGNHDHDDHDSFHIKPWDKDTPIEDGGAYWNLREALLKGFLSQSDYSIRREGTHFIIEKK